MHVGVIYLMMILSLGIASKGFPMFILFSNVLLCRTFLLKPSDMSCDNCVSSVLVECCELKPCYVGDYY